MPRYRQETEGADGWTRWIQPEPESYRAACCDCGLVHEVAFRVEDGRVQFRARRHNRATAAMRAAARRKSRN